MHVDSRMARTRDEYLTLRACYEPAQVELAIVAESPPASGRYFYDPTGAITEPLFSALMKRVGVSPATKDAGLLAFQSRGWILVDATYEPVNSLGARQRDKVIMRDHPMLVADLRRLASRRAFPIILVKANVCRLLEPILKDAGFDVINAGRCIYFPSSGQQGRFHEQFDAVVVGAGIL